MALWGKLVLHCLERGISLDEMSLEEYQAISPVFEPDIYEAISLKTCVEKRMTLGAPGQKAMEQVIRLEETYLKEQGRTLADTKKILTKIRLRCTFVDE